MHCPSSGRLCRFFVVSLVLALAVLVAGCPFIDTGGDNGDSPGQPVPPEDVELEVTVEGSGQVEQDPDGTRVKLTAIPDDGWRFDTWFGTVNSKVNPLFVQTSEATEIGARFAEIDSQADADGDGVRDGNDQCPDTLSGVEVDEVGCAAYQRDSDEDGVHGAWVRLVGLDSDG